MDVCQHVVKMVDVLQPAEDGNINTCLSYGDLTNIYMDTRRPLLQIKTAIPTDPFTVVVTIEMPQPISSSSHHRLLYIVLAVDILRFHEADGKCDFRCSTCMFTNITSVGSSHTLSYYCDPLLFQNIKEPLSNVGIMFGKMWNGCNPGRLCDVSVR